MPIQEVVIGGVRGIREPVHFILRGKSLLLHGDNGTGKSSFERALRWALRGEEEPTGETAFTTAESFRRHVRSKPDDPTVTVTFTDSSAITVRPGKFSASGSGASIREACLSGQPFLRRSELLTVLGAPPGDRFKYFETFLGLQSIDALIESISGRRTALNARATALESKVDGVLEPLRVLVPGRFGPCREFKEVVSAGEQWAVELSLDTKSDAERAGALGVRVAALAAGDTASFPYRLEEVGRALLSSRNTIEQLASVMPALLANEKRLRLALADTASVELLDHALQHFVTGEGTRCPVCRQQIDWAATKEALRGRVVALSGYSQVQREVADAVEALQAAADTTRSALNDAAGIAAKLGLNKAYPFSASPEIATIASSSSEMLVAYLRSANISTTLSTAVSSSVSWAADLVRLREVVPDSRDSAELRTAAAFFQRLHEVQPGIELLLSERASVDREAKSLDAILEALRRSRQDVARETLSAIEGRVSEYYSKIHPPGAEDDVTGAPSIDVQRHGRGTAFVRGEFGGTEIKDPTWVYSDGHLDTVGLCIFLALRRFRSGQKGDPKILVLDDVIISIDLGHSRRFLDLLRTAFDDHQVLILTHNGLFAHWCRTLLPGLTRLEIKSWTLSGGPQVGDYASARERIDGALKDGTAKEIAVTLMELLDEWTAEARYEYAVAVPAKPGEQYTLSDIWAPLMKRLKDIARSLGSDLGGAVSLLDELKDVPQVRNALAGHHNEFAQEYPRGVISTIAVNACRLIDALYCDACTAFLVPIGDRSNPSVMECPKRHKQYVAKPAASA